MERKRDHLEEGITFAALSITGMWYLACVIFVLRGGVSVRGGMQVMLTVSQNVLFLI